MKTLWKTLGGTAAFLLAAAAVGAVAVLAIDPNRHKGWIASRFEAATGRPLSIDGDVAVSLYPWLGFEVNGVGVGNAKGFGDAPLLYVEHARLRVKLLPLLRGRYEVDVVNVRNAVVHLERDAHGISNWDGLAAADESGGAASASPVALQAIALGGVTVENARFTWDDRQAGARYEVSDLNLSASGFGYGEPFDLNVRFRGTSAKPAISADAGFDAAVTYDPDARRIRIQPLNGRARIRGENVPGGETVATLSARIDADLDGEAVSVSDLAIDVLGTVIEGRIAADRIGSSTPSIRAALEIGGADLGRWFEVAEVEPLASRLADVPAPAKAFRLKADLDADLGNGDVSVSALSLGALGVGVTGALQAENMQAEDGTIRGALTARAAEPSGLLTALGQAGLARTLRSAKFEARLQGGRAGITLAPLALQAVFAGEDVPGSPAAVTLDAAGAGIDPGRETFTLDRFTLHGLGLELAGNAEVEWASSPPGFRGRLDVRPFDLRRLAGQLGQKPPLTADERALTRVALSGRFSGSTAALRVRELDFRLDDTRMTGDFEIARSAGTLPGPAVRFDLRLDEIDLDRYAAPPGSAERPEPSADRAEREAEKDRGIAPPASSRAASAAGADPPPSGSPLAAILGTARHLDGEGRLRIGKLAAAGADLEALEVRLHARDGVLELAPASAGLYGGRLTGDVRLDVRRLEEPRAAIRADLEGIDVESFLRDVAGKARVRGKGDLHAVLSAAGAGPERWRRSLGGRVSVKLRDGALAGVDLGSHLRGWKGFRDGRSVAFDPSQATEFSRLTGTLEANGGIVRLDDLEAETPLFELTGEGVLADLHDAVIDYRLLVTVADPVGGPAGRLLSALVGIELPLDVEGPLDHPRFGLDWESALGSLFVPSMLKEVIPPLPLPIPNGSGEGTDGDGAGFDPVGKLLDEVFGRRR